MKLIFIGPLPPPVHGMSAMNKAVCDHLAADGITVCTINTAPKSLNRKLTTRFSRIPIIISCWIELVCLLWKKKSLSVYIALSGGWGQLFDLCMVITARCFGARIIFHHHTFAFLINWKPLSAIIFKIAGPKTIHITLCKLMAKTLEKKYQVQNRRIVSNIAAMPIQKGHNRTTLKTIGFIGNITVEKGGRIILKIARQIALKKLPIKVVVAGPCPESSLSKDLYKANHDKIIKWIGPVYNNKKDSFFSHIDVLLMPTQYPNEAEPLVVWEALGMGAPVIAYNRGCISEQIDKYGGKIISPEKDFVADALKILDHWLSNPVEFRESSIAALKRYSIAIADRESGWSNLKNSLTDVQALEK